MVLGANSYGSVAEVEALTDRYTSSGSYGAGTVPTATQVEVFIDRISGVLNLVLAEAGFAVPVTQADAKFVLAHFVVGEVVILCEEANALSVSDLRDVRLMTGVVANAQFLVALHAAGFEQLGVTRDRSLTEGLAYWDLDDAGEDMEPIFGRKWMNQEVTDWGEE